MIIIIGVHNYIGIAFICPSDSKGLILFQVRKYFNVIFYYIIINFFPVKILSFFTISTDEFLDSDLLYLRDVLFCNSYSIKFIDKIIKIDALNTTIGLSGFQSAQN